MTPWTGEPDTSTRITWNGSTYKVISIEKIYAGTLDEAFSELASGLLEAFQDLKATFTKISVTFNEITRTEGTTEQTTTALVAPWNFEERQIDRGIVQRGDTRFIVAARDLDLNLDQVAAYVLHVRN